MQLSLLTGAAATAVVAAILLDQPEATAATVAAQTTQGSTTAGPQADGHYVLVVEGDRLGLDVSFASRKQAPWAGRPKGFESSWRLTVLDVAGTPLADIPLDVRPFATDPASHGKPAVVRGCVVIDSKIGMLVNVPRFTQASSYRFSREDARGVITLLGDVPAAKVRDLSGDQR